jgi:hypothetical protein
MNAVKIISCLIVAGMVSGCASTGGAKGPRGPKIVGSGWSTEYESYAEIGIEFTSVGDFFAFASPKRWSSPLETGGSLSWVNPAAWSEDAGRTGRILLGEAAVIGGVVAAAAGGGGGGGSSSGNSGSGGVSNPDGGPPAPPPPAPY